METENLFANELEMQARALFLQAKKLKLMALALNKRDPAQANNALKKTVEELAQKVAATIGSSKGMSVGVIRNKLRGLNSDDIEAALIWLVGNSLARSITITPQRGPTVTRYYLLKPLEQKHHE